MKKLLLFFFILLTSFYNLQAQWAPVGLGFFGGFDDNISQQRFTDIYGMIEYQDNLYVWGDFDSVDSIAAKNYARYDGSQWHSLPFTGYATDMEVFQGELYIAANTGLNSPLPNRQITKWDGNQWMALDTNYVLVDDIAKDRILDLQVYKDELYMSGVRLNVGALNTPYYNGMFNHIGIIKWTGTQYDSIPVGSGFGGFEKIYMSVFNDSLLLSSGWFGNVDGLSGEKWYFFDGSNWHLVYDHWYDGLSSNGIQIGSYFFRPSVHVSTDTGETFFYFSSGIPSDDLIKYHDKVISIRRDTLIQVSDTLLNYKLLGTGIVNPLDEIEAIAIYRDTLYAAGNFDDADGLLMNGIMKWTGDLLSIPTAMEPSLNMKESVKTYPNPATDILRIEAELPGEIVIMNDDIDVLDISITDALGRNIEVKEVINRQDDSLSKFSTSLDVSKLRSGIYNIRVTHKGRIIMSQKFVKS